MADVLRVLVVDDVELARSKVVRLLSAFPDVEVVGTAVDGMGLISAVRDLRPDLVFLDISMPEQDGISAFSEIPPADRPLVIFLTAHEHFALRAFRVDAIDYLLKPLDPDLLMESLQRVRRRLAKGALPAAGVPAKGFPERLALRTDTGVRVVPVERINWVEAVRNYMAIHLTGETFIVRSTMQGLLAQLNPDQFARIHRSAIVNARTVVEIRPFGNGDQRLRLADGTELAISRGYREALLQLLAR